MTSHPAVSPAPRRGSCPLFVPDRVPVTLPVQAHGPAQGGCREGTALRSGGLQPAAPATPPPCSAVGHTPPLGIALHGLARLPLFRGAKPLELPFRRGEVVRAPWRRPGRARRRVSRPRAKPLARPC